MLTAESTAFDLLLGITAQASTPELIRFDAVRQLQESLVGFFLQMRFASRLLREVAS